MLGAAAMLRLLRIIELGVEVVSRWCCRECGMEIELSDVPVDSLVPEPLRDIESVSEFMSKLPEHDSDMAKQLEEAEAADECLRFVGELFVTCPNAYKTAPLLCKSLVRKRARRGGGGPSPPERNLEDMRLVSLDCFCQHKTDLCMIHGSGFLLKVSNFCSPDADLQDSSCSKHPTPSSCCSLWPELHWPKPVHHSRVQ